MLIKWIYLDKMDNSSVTVSGFQFEPERDSSQEPLFKEDDENKMEQEKSSSRVSQVVEEWCKCGKCEPMLTERECRCCHEVVSHYLSGNIRGGSRNFASSKLKIFAKMIHGFQTLAIVTKGSKLDVRVFEFQPL